MRAVPVLISLMFLFVLFGMTAGTTDAASSAGMHVEGPTVAAMNATVHYKVEITGVFDVYRCSLLVAGKNLTDMNPVNQVIKTSYTGNFEFTINTPNVTQTLYLDFKGYGIMNNTGKIKIFERRMYLDVKSSYTIVASVKNPENYTVSNVTVKFYIDGRYIGNTTIDKISANSTKRVTYVWVPDVGEGEHLLEMKLSDSGVVFENNRISATQRIYIGSPPNYDWVGYLGIATMVGLATIFTFLFLGRKHGRHEAKPKWKK